MSETADLPGTEKPVLTKAEPGAETNSPGDTEPPEAAAVDSVVAPAQAIGDEPATPTDDGPALDSSGDAPVDASAEPGTETSEDARPEEPAAPDAEEPVPAKAAGETPEGALEAKEETPELPPEGKETVVEATPEEPAAAAPEPKPEPEPSLPENVLPLLAAKESRARVAGKVIGWNKGGFHVALSGVAGFCPKSQIEVGNPKRASAYIDRELEFRVLEIKENGKRIVVSRREILEEDRKVLLDQLRERKSDGQPVTGKVVSITDFGAFVDVGGLEGLVHLSQLSRKRAEHTRDVVEIGQEVQVKVLKIEKGGERISLSIKALQPDPWETIEERFEPGARFTGKVVRRTEFGLFVEIEDGIEGLLHSSQLELGKSLDDYPDGAELEGWIREAEAERRRLSLALREVTTGNPWSDIQKRFAEGDEVTGTVEQLAKFGIFVILEPGLTGLLPMSSLALPTGANPRRMYRAGQDVQVLIDSIDRKKRRISLAPAGSKLEGTRADYRSYQRRESEGKSLNAMEAAFSKLRRS